MTPARSSLLVLACSVSLLHAQVPGTQWSGTAGGFDQNEPYRSAADPSGAIYTCGYGEVVRYFGNGIEVSDVGFTLARYSADGDVLWARPLTTVNPMEVYVDNIATTSTGDVWVAGYFNSSALVIDAFTVTSSSVGTGFIARFASNGDAQFVTAWSGPGGVTQHFDICVDALDRVYVAGSSSASSIVIDGVSLANAGAGSQLLVLRFSAAGVAEWGAMSGSTSGDVTGLNVAVDAAGDVFATARFNGELDVDGGTLITSVTDQIALVKFDATGAVEWMHEVAACDPLDMTADDDGNTYICGDFQYTADFDGVVLQPLVLDGFVSAYTSDGDHRWVVGVQGDMDNELCWNVSLDTAQTRLVVGGTFVISASFGGQAVSTGTSPTDGFVMHMDTTGVVNWVKDMTGDGPTLFAQAAFDANDHLYVCGVTQSQTTYLDEPVLNVNGNQAFIARLEDVSTSVPTLNAASEIVLRTLDRDLFLIALPAAAQTVIISDALGREERRATVTNASTLSFRLGMPGLHVVTVITPSERWARKLVVE